MKSLNRAIAYGAKLMKEEEMKKADGAKDTTH